MSTLVPTRQSEQSMTDTTPTAAPAPVPTGNRFYHPELDGLRFLAFFGVFVYHVFPMLPAEGAVVATWIASVLRAGEWGVDLFFALSSYLITELLLREHDRSGSIDIKSFYIRRTLRIWPLYYAFLLFAFFIEPLIVGEQLMTRQYFVPYAVFLGNWSLAHSYTLTSSAIILWTVSIEEQFYLSWPLLVRWLTPRRIPMLAALLLIVANSTRLYLVSRGAVHEQVHFNTFARLDGIALGALVAAIYHRRGIPSIPLLGRWLLMFSGFAVWVCVVRYVDFARVLDPWLLFRYPLAALGALLVLVGTIRREGTTRGVLASRPFVFLGRISYGLYVVHYLAIALCQDFLVKRLGQAPRTTLALLSLPLTIYLAVCSYYLLEKPFLKLKLKFTHVASRPGG